jgi:antitoxin component YwqK of YwqJK toxin-antitoxin module
MVLSFSHEVFSQTGYQAFTYPGGQVASEGMLRDGRPDGLWKTYYENGQLKSIGKRTDFLLDSTWVFFSEVGDTSLIVNYKRDLKNGPRFTFGKDDIVMEPFVNDVRQGEGKRYDLKRHLIQTVTYKNGVEEGISPVFDTTGLLCEIITYKKGFVMTREAINRYDREGKKHGYWKTFFDDWSVHTECYYRHGMRDGFYKEYDEKGNLKKITKFVNDVEQVVESDMKPLVVQHEYYPNGKVKREASFRDGKREGVWREFDEQGNVLNSQTYQKGVLVGQGIVDTDGKRRGLFKEFYPDNSLRAEGVFVDGLRSGEWKFYYHNGQIQEIGSYKEGQPDGIWTWYYDNGQKQIEEQFFKGTPNGSYKEYDSRGNIIVTGTYFYGMKNGKWTEEIGDMRTQGEYRNDKQIGEWVSYYDNDKLAFKGTFNAGYPDGEHFFYYQNGRLREVQKYAAGVKHGDWKKYLDTGELYFTVTYDQGKEVKYDGEALDDNEIIKE